MLRLIVLLLLVLVLLPPTLRGQERPAADRVSFVLKNGLGYQRMFRVEGPGIAYGFSMGRRESVPCVWPVGSRLYFSQDGETTSDLILTVTAADAGQTLSTNPDSRPKSGQAAPTVSFRLRNPSMLPRRTALISYAPGARGNGTTIFRLFSWASRKFEFPVGTKLYLADDKQVETVMSGRRIDDGPPFLTVSADDAGRVIDLD